MNCDYYALKNTEQPNLIKEFNEINNAISSFIGTCRELCKSDVWTGEAEKVYYDLISNIVDNYSTVYDQFSNIGTYVNGVADNYKKADASISTNMFM